MKNVLRTIEETEGGGLADTVKKLFLLPDPLARYLKVTVSVLFSDNINLLLIDSRHQWRNGWCFCFCSLLHALFVSVMDSKRLLN